MANIDVANSQTVRSYEGGRTRLYVISNTIDFTSTAFGAGGTNGDVLKLLKIAGETIVTHVTVEVKTAVNANATMDVGITGADTDGFGASFALESPGVKSKLTNTGYYTTGGYFFATEGTVDGLLIANLGANGYNIGKIIVRAVCIDMGSSI